MMVYNILEPKSWNYIELPMIIGGFEQGWFKLPYEPIFEVDVGYLLNKT